MSKTMLFYFFSECGTMDFDVYMEFKPEPVSFFHFLKACRDCLTPL